MSNSKAENAIDELDLSDIISLFKRWLYSVLALFFKAIDYLFKFWWVVVLLVVIGVALGKFTMSPPSYSATIIVKTNFNSQAYVYNAIEQLESKIADKDISFISKNKLGGEEIGVLSAEITPIIDVVSLLGGISNSDSRSLGSVLKELTVEDDEELFASERFYSNYQYHKLEVFLQDKDQGYVASVLDYVNKQPSMRAIKEGYVKNQQERIVANTTTLNQIDALINNYTENIAVVARNAENLSFYNNQNNVNVNGALDLKNKIVLETEELKNEQITSTDALVALSDVQIVQDISFKDKKYLYYPILLVFLFLFLAGARYTYTVLRKQLVDEKFLD